jgi:hypothetical protein
MRFEIAASAFSLDREVRIIFLTSSPLLARAMME